MRILNHDMQRFLTYTNFEIDIDNEKEDILKKCINRAYRDLSRRIPYKYSLSMIKNMKKEDAVIPVSALKRTGQEELLDVIESILNKERSEDEHK